MFRNINILETCTIFEANLKAGHQTCKRYLTMFDSWDMCLQRSLLIGTKNTRWWRFCRQASQFQWKTTFLMSVDHWLFLNGIDGPFTEFCTKSSNIIKRSLHVCCWPLWSPHEYVNCGVCNKIKTFWNSCKVPELLVVLWVGHGITVLVQPGSKISDHNWIEHNFTFLM